MQAKSVLALILLTLAVVLSGFWLTDPGHRSPATRAGAPASNSPARGSRSAEHSAVTAGSASLASVITGRVVDRVGKALRAVRVSAQVDTSKQQLPASAAIFDAGTTKVCSSTGNDGHFRLVLTGEAAVTIVAHHPHCPPTAIAHSLPTVGGQDHDLGEVSLPILLGLLVEVRSRVSNLAIQGARVRLVDTPARSDLPGFAETTSSRIATTDTEGIATFFGIQPGTCSMQVEARGHATREIAHRQPSNSGPAPRTLVQLERGVAVAGRVLDADGSPIPGALVACTPSESGSDTRLTTRTRIDGKFHLDGLAKVQYQIEVESFRHGRASQDGWNPGAGFVTIRLPRGREVGGRVLSRRTRQPVAEARVNLEVDSDGPVLRDGRIYRLTTHTNSAGNFRFRGVPAGIVHLTASSEDHGPIRLRLGTTERIGTPISLLLEEGFRVTGKVLGPAGQPFQNAVIQTADNRHNTVFLPGLVDRVVLGRRPLPRVQSQANGDFQVPGLSAGCYRLVVRAEGLPPLLSQPFEAVAGQHKDLGIIQLMLGGSVEGWARQHDGKPAAGAVVYLHPTDNRPVSIGGAQVRCDARGHFHLPKVAPGSYRMFYDYPDRDTPQAAAAVRNATGVELRVLDGHVLRQDLKPRVR